MLIDIVVAVATVLAAAAIVDLGLAGGVGIAGVALLLFSFVLSELLARRQSLRFTGLVLALYAAVACFVLGHLAVLSVAALDGAPDIARQFFAPLTVGAAAACIGALAHRARYHVSFSWMIAAAAGLYAVFGALKLSFGNAWLHL
jgi:hypothetical protein